MPSRRRWFDEKGKEERESTYLCEPIACAREIYRAKSILSKKDVSLRLDATDH